MLIRFFCVGFRPRGIELEFSGGEFIQDDRNRNYVVLGTFIALIIKEK